MVFVYLLKASSFFEQDGNAFSILDEWFVFEFYYLIDTYLELSGRFLILNIDISYGLSFAVFIDIVHVTRIKFGIEENFRATKWALGYAILQLPSSI